MTARSSERGEESADHGRPARSSSARGPALPMFFATLAALLIVGLGAGGLLEAQGGVAAAGGVRLVTLLACVGWGLFGLYSRLGPATDFGPLAAAGIHLGMLVGSLALAEWSARAIAVPFALLIQVVGSSATVWFMWRRSRSSPRLRSIAVAIAVALGAIAMIWFCSRHEMQLAALTLGGTTVMAAGYLIGLAALRAALTGPGLVAVARTVVDEAVRMRVTLVLGILLVLSLPILPLLLDPDERLSYRVQFLLTWSLGSTGFLLGLLTVFLGCGSFCGDIDTNRIHLTLTKPLGRLEYLVGKWIGLAAVNLLLVGLAGAGIYTLTGLLSRADALSDIDRRALDEQVLAARVSLQPSHPAGEAFESTLQNVLRELEKDVPDAFKADPEGTRARIRSEYVTNWHTLRPDRVAEFLFTGLQAAKEKSDWVHLRIRPYGDVPGIDHADVRFAMWLNGRPYPYRDNEHVSYTLPGGMTHTLELPAAAIDDQGSLKITLENKNLLLPGATQPVWITLPPGRGLQLLHNVGEFRWNYLRGLLVLWLKLLLVAAVSIAASTFLGFPMAVLTSLFVFIAALGSGFIGDSLDYSTGLDMDDAGVLSMARLRWMIFRDFILEGNYWEAFKTCMAIVGELFMAIVPPFDRYDTVSAVAGGMQVGLTTVGECLLRLGIIAPATLGLLGWWLFEQRDLVRSNS